MQKKLDLINKYWNYSLDVQSFGMEEKTWDIIISLFNGEDYSSSPSKLVLKWVIIASFLKQAYLEENLLTPYGPLIFKVNIINWSEILKMMKKLNSHIDYLSTWRYHFWEKTKNMNTEAIELLSFEAFWPKKLFHIFISWWIDWDFLCEKVNFKYLDFEDNWMKEINLDFNKI